MESYPYEMINRFMEIVDFGDYGWMRIGQGY